MCESDTCQSVWLFMAIRILVCKCLSRSGWCTETHGAGLDGLSVACSYCECFASGNYCGPECNCLSCCNNAENEATRQEAVEATLERNPNAFRPKIAPSPDVKSEQVRNTARLQAEQSRHAQPQHNGAALTMAGRRLS